MSTLQHIPQQTFRMRLGRKSVIALLVIALAIAAVAAVVVLSGSGEPAVSASDGQSAPVSQTDPKYWVTHQGLATAGAEKVVVVSGAKSDTDPKYWVTHADR